MKGWLTLGRREAEGDYAEFAEAMERARQAARERPEPMDADELAVVVSEMARRGSVQAAKLRWEMLRSSTEPEESADEPLAEVDELARRHRAG